MYIKQVSVFVENKSGKLADVLNVLGENNIDIRALSIADKTDFGILRLIVDNPEKAESVLRDFGMVVKLTDVLAIGVEDKSGGLSSAVAVLKDGNIEIEYMYAFVGKSKYGAQVMLKVNKPEQAEKVLRASNISLIEADDIYA